jgi:hypothetical protein
MRSAVFSANAVFAQRSPAAGHPAEAARAIAQMEFLAVDLPQNNNLTNASATLVPDLNIARREWRGARGKRNRSRRHAAEGHGVDVHFARVLPH